MAINHATILGGSDNPAYAISKNEWNAALTGNGLGLYNITDPPYNATTGAADNTTAINAAIDAAEAAGGGTVFVPTGTFLGAGILLKSNVTLRGNGWNSVLKLKNSVSDTLVGIGLSGPKVVNAAVMDLKLDGNKANQTEDTFCFGLASGLNGTDYMTVQNVWVANSLRTAIYLEGAHNNVLGCLVTDCGNTQDPGRTGIVISGENLPGGFGRVIGNHVRNCTEYGIKLYNNSNESIIADNVIDTTSRYGIYVQSTDHASLVGNVIRDAGNAGILIQCTDDGQSSNNNSITGGSITSSTISGILLWQGGTGTVIGTTITGVTIEGNGGSGITLDEAPNTMIAGCQIVGNATDFSQGSAGIDVLSGSTNTTITGNLIRNNGNATFGNGIWAFATVTDITVSGNRIFNDGSGLQAYGIALGGSCDYWTIVGNNVRGNTAAGMSLVGSNNVVTNNVGWLMNKSGATSVADGGTVTHGLAGTPTKVRVTPSTSGEFVSVTALGATTFTVAIKKHDGTAGTTQTVYWEAEV